MLPILNSKQIKLADKYTIEHEPITSIDLMERASVKCVEWLKKHYSLKQKFTIICAQGNNGGDGLAIARMLHFAGYNVCVFVLQANTKGSDDFEINLNRLQNLLEVTYLHEDKNEINISEDSIVIDAIFGIGLNKPITNWIANVVQQINKLNNTVISIDMPSGLFADKTSHNNKNVIKSHFTLSFEYPKLAFMFPENQKYMYDFTILPIGLSNSFINQIDVKTYFVSSQYISRVLKKRNKFSHKGIYGHSCIIAGSKGKIGAAVLAAKSCIRSGTGLLTIHSPECGVNILQTSVPEAMLSIDKTSDDVSLVHQIEKYTAIGVGPGIGISKNTTNMLKTLIQNYHAPLVIDADALNILNENKTFLDFLPKNSILTPHLKEFERLFGTSSNYFERLELQKQVSIKYQVFIILKGAHTCITSPEGFTFFNSTGNPGMSTGGSGDVLTGVITALLAQQYSSLEACLIGVFMHGLSGDLAVNELGEQSLCASDIIDFLPKAFMRITK